jgi:rhodanese-related sulfurtransferase
MKELNRTDRLTIATILVAVILVIGLVTLKKPDIPYARSAEETARLIIAAEDVISPEEVASVVTQSDDKFYLVDVRNPIEYHKSHIGQAVNIPVPEVLDRNNRKTFSQLADDGVTIVLYGKDQLEANGVWLVLKQTGYNNIRVLSGGYDYYAGKSNAPATSPEIPGYLVEKPRCDYKAVLSSYGSTGSSTETKAPEPVNIIKKEKKSATEGGC